MSLGLLRPERNWVWRSIPLSSGASSSRVQGMAGTPLRHDGSEAPGVATGVS